MDKCAFASTVFGALRRSIDAASVYGAEDLELAEREQRYKEVVEHIGKLTEACRKSLAAVDHLRLEEEVAKHHVEDAIGPFTWLLVCMMQSGERRYLLPSVEGIIAELRQLHHRVPLYDAAMASRSMRLP